MFKIKEEKRVVKVYFPPFKHLAKNEQINYMKVEGDSRYPKLYEVGRNYIVLDFIEGKTFFQCLQEGVPILPEHVKQVDDALHSARERGLNPSDIHLHNLIITKHGDVCIIDIARFSQSKQCEQWNDLKSGYYKHYHKAYFPSKLPKWLMNVVAALYRTRKGTSIHT
ncbi:protein kinase family protein [Geomicrobium sp. JCM 19038]|uniref:protein kinase family protein n=1 Tax=Geomicrobium sp. JCM 19038 TaxID=1460635 RepID=UPI00045F3CF9|nr:protein kinase family protein [Geomicrobium sp. JCM 19038]GAK09841.1 serine/threonine protein kinase [Geomicrobium sp. JCM 19038]